MRRMITRLIMAQLIPLAIRAGKKAFRNRKQAAQNNDAIEADRHHERLDTDDSNALSD